MAYYWTFLYDPSTFAMLALAMLTILYGAYQSVAFQFSIPDDKAIEDSSVKMKTAIILPVLGSITLVLLFFFLNWLIYLLIIFVSISSFSSTSFIIYTIIHQHIKKRGWEKSWNLRWVGDVDVSGIISMCSSAFVIILWLVTKHWIPTDILAVCIAATALCFVRLPSLKISSVILLLFMVYDVFWVYISPFIFKKNVMVTVAQKVSDPSLPIPMLVSLPRVLDYGVSMLGVGDMVLPGLFLCFLYRYDNHHRLPFANGFFLKAWIGYGIGLIITFFAVVLMKSGQPALFFLVPCTLVPTVVFAYFKGHLGSMWNGMPIWIPYEKKQQFEDAEMSGEVGSHEHNKTKPEEQEGLLQQNELETV